MTTPILGLTEMSAAQSQPHIVVNAIARGLEAFAQSTASTITNSPPGSPTDGTVVIVGTSGTGDFSGKNNKIAFYSSGWLFLTPTEGWRFRVNDVDNWYVYDGSVWNVDAGGVSTFTALTDAPASYTGAGLKTVRVNSGASALEFMNTVAALTASITGKPGAADIYNIIVPVALTIPASLTGSAGYSGTNATSSSVFTLSKNGTSFGTITFSSGSSTGALSAASSTSFSAGDRLTITCPSSQDATLANVALTIYGTRD